MSGQDQRGIAWIIDSLRRNNDTLRQLVNRIDEQDDTAVEAIKLVLDAIDSSNNPDGDKALAELNAARDELVNVSNNLGTSITLLATFADEI